MSPAPDGQGKPIDGLRLDDVLTSWTTVRQARDGDAESKARALERLALTYHRPLLGFFRVILGSRSADAEDATQAFFERLLEKEFLRNIREEKSFRGFLKTACRRFLINRWESEVARKPRDGRTLSGLPDGNDVAVPAGNDEIERVIDREFRMYLITKALESTRQELMTGGNQRCFEMLCEQVLTKGGSAPSREDLANRFGVSVNDVRNGLHLARQAFKKALRKLASDLSDDPDGELRELGL